MTVIDNIFDPEPVLEQVPILDCRRTLDSRDRAVIRNIEGIEKVGVKRPPLRNAVGEKMRNADESQYHERLFPSPEGMDGNEALRETPQGFVRP